LRYDNKRKEKLSSQILHKTKNQIEDEKLHIELAKQDPKQLMLPA